MSDQSEALSLADELDETSEHITRYTNSRGDSLCSAAAAELRRQNSRIEELEALSTSRLEQMEADRKQALDWKQRIEADEALMRQAEKALTDELMQSGAETGCSSPSSSTRG